MEETGYMERRRAKNIKNKNGGSRKYIIKYRKR
jgi:hypothetical protein